MRLIKIMLIVLVVAACKLHAQTVISDSNLTFQPDNTLPPANYRFTAFQNVAATDPTSMWFKYDGTNVLFVSENIDQGSDWYVVQPGDFFTQTTAGSYPPLVTPGPVGHPQVNVGDGDIWLGVATGQSIVSSTAQRSVFGWVLLRPTFPGSGTLTMIRNAMSYASPGIIVGTTTVVPEPCLASLLVAAACLWGSIRTRRK